MKNINTVISLTQEKVSPRFRAESLEKDEPSLSGFLRSK